MRFLLKAMCALLAGAMCFCSGAGICLAAGAPPPEPAAKPAEEAAKDEGEGPPGPGVSVDNVILVEQTTLRTLFERGADERRAPASITKVMTMLLVMEALDAGSIALDDPVTCSEYASSMGGSQIWLEPYEQMSVRELLKAAAVQSANDAAVALAEHVAGSEEAFVALMNEKAQELGLQNTLFANSAGLDEEGHYTSARDIAIMAAALLSHPEITEYTTIWMDELRGGETQIVNTNKLIYHYPGATGLKTGSTDNAGRCLCASAERDGMKLISVVLGAPSSDAQFGDSRALLDWGFTHYMSAPVALPEGTLSPVRVARGVQQSVDIYAQGPESVVVPREDAPRIAYEVTMDENVTAPVEKGQTVGRVAVRVGSSEICSFDLRAGRGVPRMTFPRAAGILARSLFSMGGAASPSAPAE